MLQRQPSQTSCLPTAFAMVVGAKAEQVIAALGHDDDRGFHPDELCWWALGRGWAFVTFDVEPAFVDGGPVPGKADLEAAMRDHDGVLVGQVDGNDHAVAWCSKMRLVLDPNGTTYPPSRFSIRTFFAAVRFGR